MQYAHTRETLLSNRNFRSVHVEKFQDVSNKVAAAFEYNIHPEFNFLQQFYSQSKQINGVGSNVLQGYLNRPNITAVRRCYKVIF